MTLSSDHEWILRRTVSVVVWIAAASCASYANPDDPCRPHDILATLQTPIGYQDLDGRSVVPTCTVERSGVVTMRYTPLSCEDPAESWWAGCAFAANQDLLDFDARGRGQGVIAVKVCVENFVSSSLNLRYGSPAFVGDGRTKYMPLIDREEQFEGTGCRLVYLSPSDACYSFDRCGTAVGCAPGGNGTCDTFARSQLVIMNEWCWPSTAVPDKPTVVTIEQATYFPESCACEDTTSCASPRVCRRDGWPAAAKCDAIAGEECPGVCAP